MEYQVSVPDLVLTVLAEYIQVLQLVVKLSMSH